MPHREWGCDSREMHILTRNGNVQHQESGCDSMGMHILTANEHSLHREKNEKIPGVPKKHNSFDIL